MRIIGNILTDSKIDNNGMYNVKSNLTDIDNSVPTLIIGWNKTHKLFPDADILDWKINDNTYWTFGKREKNYIYEERIQTFQEMAIAEVKKKVEYYFFNILIESKVNKQLLFKKIGSDIPKLFFLQNDMVYITFGDTKVYGISLIYLDYEGKNRKTFFNKLYSSPNSKIITKIENIDIDLQMKLRNNAYVIPYLLF